MRTIAKLKDQARLHEQREEWDKAIQAYEQAIHRMDEEEGEVELHLFNRIGDLHLRLGRQADAVRCYEDAADRYAAAGFYNNAIALCNKALRYMPDRAEIYLKLGRYSGEQGFFTDARRWFLEYAQRMERAGRLEQALDALGEYADLSGDVEIRELIAQQIAAHGNIPAAVAQYRKALELRVAAGDDAAAEELRARILDLDPNADLTVSAPATSGEPVGPPTGGAYHAMDPLPGLEFHYEPDSAGSDEDGTAESSDRADAAAADLGPEASTSPPGDLGLEPTSLATGEPDAEEDENGYAPVDVDDRFVADRQDPSIAENELPELTDHEDLAVADLDDLFIADHEDPSITEHELPDAADDGDPFVTEPDLPDAAEHEAAFIGEHEHPEPTAHEDLFVTDDPAPFIAEPDLLDSAAHEPLDDAGQVLHGTETHEALDDFGSEEFVPSAEVSPDDDLDSLFGHDEEDEFAADPLPELDDGSFASWALDGPDAMDADIEGPAVLPGLDDGAEVALDDDPAEPLPLLDGGWGEEPAVDGIGGEIPETDDITFDQDPYVGAIQAEATDIDDIFGEDTADPAVMAMEPDAGSEADEVGYVDLSNLVNDELEAAVGAGSAAEDGDSEFARLLSQFRAKAVDREDDGDPGSHYDLGLAFKDMGLIDEAIAEFEKALRGGENELKIYEELGRCFMMREDYDLALKALGRALRLPSVDGHDLLGVYYLMGRCHEELGDRDAAREAFEQVVELSSDFNDVAERLARL